MAKHEQLKKYIKIRKAAEHNLKDDRVWTCRGDEFVVFTGLSRAPASLRWRLIRSTQRGRGGIWSRSPHMPASFWDRWRSRTWRAIEGLPPAISIDSEVDEPQPAFHGRHGDGDLRLFPPALCDGSGRRTVRSAGSEVYRKAERSIRWRIRSWRCRSARRLQLLAPVVRGTQGTARQGCFESARKRSGYVRVRIDGRSFV